MYTIFIRVYDGYKLFFVKKAKFDFDFILALVTVLQTPCRGSADPLQHTVARVKIQSKLNLACVTENN